MLAIRGRWLKGPGGNRLGAALRAFELPAYGQPMTCSISRAPIEHVWRPENPDCLCPNGSCQMKRSCVIADDQGALLQKCRQAAKRQRSAGNGSVLHCLHDLGY